MRLLPPQPLWHRFKENVNGKINRPQAGCYNSDGAGFSARIATDFRLPSGVLGDNREIRARDD
jgi:hypothetical protein